MFMSLTARMRSPSLSDVLDAAPPAVICTHYKQNQVQSDVHSGGAICRVPTTLQNSFSLTFPWFFQTKWIIFP